MNDSLAKAATEVLRQNRRDGFTVPAGDLYPHQWLWDSCFIAIGLRHTSLEVAMAELRSLTRGQWANGMLPHIIFSTDKKHRREHNLWQSWLSPHAPNGIITSGLTQPPMLAEAVWQVGQKLALPARRSWYREMLPRIAKYHAWLYAERSSESGLAILLHPYESGLDNSPPWATQMRNRAWPWWIKLIEFSRLEAAVSLVRRDTHYVPADQRMSNIEAIACWNLQRRLRNHSYDAHEILKKPKLAVEDLAFNCILIRANSRLAEIARAIKQELPPELAAAARKNERALEELWDEQTGQYYSRDAISGQLIKEPAIATLLPLYAVKLDERRTTRLVELTKKRSQFRANWPLPSVPTSSEWFRPLGYWQGPTWVNINWLIIDGLRRNSFLDEATELKERTLELVAAKGCSEYFSPLDGSPGGAEDFSWTAALAIDLLS